MLLGSMGVGEAEDKQTHTCIYTRGHSHIKFDGKLVFQEVVHIPTLPKPPRSIFGRFQSEPVVIRLLVLANILHDII